MIEDDLFEEEQEEGEGQGWLMTFSDLMSLLLCFFVLILAMAEVDIIRYKQLADSMQELSVCSGPRNTRQSQRERDVATEFRPGIQRRPSKKLSSR